MCAGMQPSTETGTKISRIRTRVQQVVVRHMWALPRFFFEMVAQMGSPVVPPAKHGERAAGGKRRSYLGGGAAWGVGTGRGRWYALDQRAAQEKSHAVYGCSTVLLALASEMDAVVKPSSKRRSRIRRRESRPVTGGGERKEQHQTNR